MNKPQAVMYYMPRFSEVEYETKGIELGGVLNSCSHEV